jgi:hypothetical protein
MTLTTLAGVRELMRHLQAGHRERSTWAGMTSGLGNARD